MKYFKFTQISAESGISWAIAQPLSGPSFPPLPGLSNILQLNYNNLYYIGEVSDEALPNPDNYCFELTTEERALELKKVVDFEINKRLSTIYTEEKDFRNKIFGKYHESATIAGVNKYSEAKEILSNPSAAAISLRQEAILRGIDVTVLANRVVNNHEDFLLKEAKISGLRGKILDRLNNFNFDLENPDISFNEFHSKEILGTVTVKVLEKNKFVDKEENLSVGKYTLSLDKRYLKA